MKFYKIEISVFINKVLWSIATSIGLGIVCLCYLDTMAELTICNTDHMTYTLKIFTVCSFTEKVCPPFLKLTAAHAGPELGIRGLGG